MDSDLPKYYKTNRSRNRHNVHIDKLVRVVDIRGSTKNEILSCIKKIINDVEYHPEELINELSYIINNIDELLNRATSLGYLQIRKPSGRHQLVDNTIYYDELINKLSRI